MGVVVLLAVFWLLQPIPHEMEHRARQHPLPPPAHTTHCPPLASAVSHLSLASSH